MEFVIVDVLAVLII